MHTHHLLPASLALAASLVPLCAGSVAAQESVAPVRLKDVAVLQGPTSTSVIGYGLVVGLNKTGDRRQAMFSTQSLVNMLQRFGVVVPPLEVRVENVAAVMVSGEIGAYSQQGSRVDITVSSIGDARSLQGGTLLPTPLHAPDGTVIALGQGPLSIGGFGAAGGENSVSVNHLTVGRVPRGATVQIARQTAIEPTDLLRLTLHEPDFTSASHIAAAINQELRTGVARVVDPGTVQVLVPSSYRTSVPDFIARLEPVPVLMDAVARIVINERTGTVVLGGDVRLGPAAVAHGNLSVKIATEFDVSQPGPLSKGGQTAVTPKVDVNVEEGRAQLVTLQSGTTLGEVVQALNTLGVSPRDIISIVQALKAAGALRAEIVIL